MRLVPTNHWGQEPELANNLLDVLQEILLERGASPKFPGRKPDIFAEV